MKGELLEGGIRVPLIARWPQHIRAGSVTQQTAMTMDFLPTLLEAAGVKPDASRPPDGMSLLGAFGDPARVTDRALYWRFHAHMQAAARRGRYKFLRMGKAEYLFDVVADPQERGNLKAHQPQVFKELRAGWEKWNAEMLAYTEKNFTYDLREPATLPDRY
jgi:arylsulfatase A-like enzyme